ncbi:hypothetical protein NQZ68_010691 [Dissostichus eleginoides]|nr:hypothetical protein NQZ68_010691 [Dissostichus eleginoides]
MGRSVSRDLIPGEWCSTGGRRERGRHQQQQQQQQKPRQHTDLNTQTPRSCASHETTPRFSKADTQIHAKEDDDPPSKSKWALLLQNREQWVVMVMVGGHRTDSLAHSQVLIHSESECLSESKDVGANGSSSGQNLGQEGISD